MKRLNDRVAKTIFLLAFGIFVPNLFGTAITSGSIHVPLFGFAGTFTLSEGTDFTVTGGFENLGGGWAPYSCYGCDVDVLGVDGLVVDNSFLGGSATINGTTLNAAWGDLAHTGPFASLFTVTGPPIVLNGPGTYVGPFSFTGQLCGTTPTEKHCPVSFPLLTGSGEVSVVVTRFALPVGIGPLVASDAIYTFEVPEPASIVLVFTAGLILLAGRERLTGPSMEPFYRD